MARTPVIVVHGGAGVLRRGHDRLRRQQQAGLVRALEAGVAAFEYADGTATAAEAAVIAAVEVLEDEPTFNAGRGAVYTSSGHIEHDAAIMRGDSAFGGVGAIHGIRNPIRAAKAVMDEGTHLLLCGTAATAFALAAGCVEAEQSWFHTELRYRQLIDSIHSTPRLDHSESDMPTGTVGAVALDAGGHLAAATSTGGMTGKHDGRVGDTPVPGAGTYARDGLCAVSCTGRGEEFLRAVAAYDVAARMGYSGLSLQEATNATIDALPPETGGLIAVDADGNVTLPYSTAGMLRGFARPGEAPCVGVFEVLE